MLSPERADQEQESEPIEEDPTEPKVVPSDLELILEAEHEAGHR